MADLFVEKEKSILNTCSALSRYYKSLNKEYNGLFSKYCDENGLDEESVLEEFNSDPSECILVDFDPNFPFDTVGNIWNDDSKQQFVFDLISRCYNNPNLSFGLPQFNASLFEINDDDLKRVCNEYKIQCPIIFNNGLNDDLSLIHILAIADKYKFDYLQHLIDDYFRCQIYNELILKQKGYSIEKWSLSHQHFVKLKSISSTYSELIKSAVKSFNIRCHPILMFNNLIKINDSIEITIQYIATAIEWISNLVEKSNKAICPFQIDLCIAYKIDDDDNDDDDDDDNDNKENKENNIDIIGDIESKLKTNKLKYEKYEYLLNLNKPKTTRLFNEIYIKFINKLDSEEKKIFPHNRRFITFIDRRDDNMDNLWMYHPPNNCYNIPINVVPEWYLSSSRICLLPNIQYNDGKIAEKPNVNNSDNIGSSNHCKGSLLTLSFIIKEIDSIKCYLYWNGQIIRFMPKDIKTIFPQIFNMNWNNKENQKFINNNNIKINKLINKMNEKLVDKHFENFCMAIK